jgi:DNA-binding CsgD family transcriptional regulator
VTCTVPVKLWLPLKPDRHTAAPAQALVILLVAEGLSSPDIASRLFISRAAVKAHPARIFTKLDAIDRAQLVAPATRATAEGTPGRG